MKGETEELQEKESLDDSTLSIESEIKGQKRCLEILNDNANANVPKDFVEGGGFKSIKIIGAQDKPEFIQFVNNKETTGKATNDNVFGYEECFYHAVLRTIENEKGIKFIGKNIQRFAGGSLLNAVNDGGDDVNLCLFLIANLFHQVDNSPFLMSILKENISYAVSKMLLLKPNNDGELKEMYNYATTQSSTGKSRREREQKWLQAICKKLETIIDLFKKDDKEIINKFLCQLFFLIFFTNKADIKPGNILVEKNNNNVKIIHTDVSDFLKCIGMFDKFENHELDGWGFNKLFLKTIWKRISSKELAEYFNEYVKKYTLTEKKIKKIISRTVRNVFRSNDDIETNKINEIQSQRLKDICRRSFTRMQEYMQYMLNTVIKEIKLDDGNDEKKSQLINVLKQNCQVLNDVLAGHTIDDCVDSSITKYQTLKQKILHKDEKYNNNDKIQTRLEPEIQSTDKDNIINTTNNMQAKYAKYHCWIIGDNNYVGYRTDGDGFGCCGCDIC